MAIRLDVIPVRHLRANQSHPRVYSGKQNIMSRMNYIYEKPFHLIYEKSL